MIPYGITVKYCDFAAENQRTLDAVTTKLSHQQQQRFRQGLHRCFVVTITERGVVTNDDAQHGGTRAMDLYVTGQLTELVRSRVSRR